MLRRLRGQAGAGRAHLPDRGRGRGHREEGRGRGQGPVRGHPGGLLALGPAAGAQSDQDLPDLLRPDLCQGLV